jgi:hypothetical protein
MDVWYSADVQCSVNMVDVCTQLMEAGGECTLELLGARYATDGFIISVQCV